MPKGVIGQSHAPKFRVKEFKPLPLGPQQFKTLQIVKGNPGITIGKTIRSVSRQYSNGSARERIKILMDKGLLRYENGDNNSKHLFLTKKGEEIVS